MGWADFHIQALGEGKTVQFRPKGDSMTGKINNGQLVTVIPPPETIDEGSVVLCKVNGNQYLHLVSAIGQDGRYQTSNNKGHVNGWCTKANIFGVVIKVED
jgi:phage repressor protein C with HTH and peptisase S24 domain